MSPDSSDGSTKIRRAHDGVCSSAATGRAAADRSTPAGEEAVAGKPISPDILSAIPSRRAQLNFLRAGVYELERECAAPAVAANDLLPPLEEKGGNRPKATKPLGQAPAVRIALPRTVEPVAVGKNLELRFFDSAAAAKIEQGIAELKTVLR